MANTFSNYLLTIVHRLIDWFICNGDVYWQQLVCRLSPSHIAGACSVCAAGEFRRARISCVAANANGCCTLWLKERRKKNSASCYWWLPCRNNWIAAIVNASSSATRRRYSTARILILLLHPRRKKRLRMASSVVCINLLRRIMAVLARKTTGGGCPGWFNREGYLHRVFH